MENRSTRMTTARRPIGLWPLAALVLSLALLSGCTATPITLPFDELGLGMDAMAADLPWGNLDSATSPDAGVLPDTRPPAGDATGADAASDGPPPDGMLDGGAGDAEAGPATDALTDISVGDLTVGG